MNAEPADRVVNTQQWGCVSQCLLEKEIYWEICKCIKEFTGSALEARPWHPRRKWRLAPFRTHRRKPSRLVPLLSHSGYRTLGWCHLWPGWGLLLPTSRASLEPHWWAVGDMETAGRAVATPGLGRICNAVSFLSCSSVLWTVDNLELNSCLVPESRVLREQTAHRAVEMHKRSSSPCVTWDPHSG